MDAKVNDQIEMVKTKVIDQFWGKPPIILPTGLKGTIVGISKYSNGLYYIPFCWIKFDDFGYYGVENAFFKIMQVQVDLKSLVETVANDLLKANNTVTTLEVKTELRVKYPQFYWTQAIVSGFMDNLAKESKFSFKNNGAFRVYSLYKNVKFKNVPVAKVVPAKAGKISRKEALAKMQNSKGHFFTVVFVKQDGSERTMNCQYLKDQGNIELGYVKVKEASKAKAGVNAIRNVNLQTLKSIRIGGQTYTIK